ncbi:MAG: hypothetical protein JXB50_16990 [Spirochaetes bacterium]|nr:hypothetical protein [Spirochaetota bacterium]
MNKENKLSEEIKTIEDLFMLIDMRCSPLFGQLPADAVIDKFRAKKNFIEKVIPSFKEGITQMKKNINPILFCETLTDCLMFMIDLSGDRESVEKDMLRRLDLKSKKSSSY